VVEPDAERAGVLAWFSGFRSSLLKSKEQVLEGCDAAAARVGEQSQDNTREH
jgi:hypothetical protein